MYNICRQNIYIFFCDNDFCATITLSLLISINSKKRQWFWRNNYIMFAEFDWFEEKSHVWTNAIFVTKMLWRMLKELLTWRICKVVYIYIIINIRYCLLYTYEESLCIVYFKYQNIYILCILSPYISPSPGGDSQVLGVHWTLPIQNYLYF